MDLSSLSSKLLPGYHAGLREGKRRPGELLTQRLLREAQLWVMITLGVSREERSWAQRAGPASVGQCGLLPTLSCPACAGGQ